MGERLLIKLDLEKLTLLSAALLIVLAGALVVRGGGYGIAGLSWDSELVVSRSNLRVGPMTVVEGDRLLSVNSRTVNRDADIRGVLRSLEADEIWLEVDASEGAAARRMSRAASKPCWPSMRRVVRTTTWIRATPSLPAP